MIVAEFCVIKSCYSSIIEDLLPQNLPLRRLFIAFGDCNFLNMVDILQKAIGAMSLEEEEPLVLPDSLQFRVFDENATSLLGRLLNPDC